MAIRTEEAFVLKRIPLRESSMLGTLFTRRQGKVTVVVKGIRKEKRLRLAAFEPFTKVTAVYYERHHSDIFLCSDLQILKSNSALRSRLDTLGYASYATELVDQLFGPGDPREDVFELLKFAYQQFELYPPTVVARAFEVKILEKVGWLPVLTRCASCDKRELDDVYFSPKQGGVICRACDRGEFGTIPISAGSLQSLLFFRDHPMAQAVALKLGRQTERELERISDRFLRFHLNYPLRSRKFLAELHSVFKSESYEKSSTLSI